MNAKIIIEDKVSIADAKRISDEIAKCLTSLGYVSWEIQFNTSDMFATNFEKIEWMPPREEK